MSLILVCPYKASILEAFIPSAWTTVDVSNTLRMYKMKVLPNEIILFPNGWTVANFLLRSTDGKNWTKLTFTGGISAAEFNDLWIIGGVYYASMVAANNGGSPELWKSTNLRSWTKLAVASGLQDFIAYTDRFSVVVASNGPYAYQSTNLGVSWQAATISPGASSAQNVAQRALYGPNNVLYYPASGFAGIWKSLNGGQSWAQASIAGLDTGGGVFDGFYTGTRTILGRVGLYTNENIASSNVWTTRKAGTNISYIHGSGNIVLAGSYGSLSANKSTDGGLTWTTQNYPVSVDCVRYFKGVWVASRSDGKIMYATA